MRAQFRLAATIIAFGVAILGGIPLLFWLVPASRTWELFGIPLAWIIIGVAVYPVTVLAAASYVRRATKIESDFTDVIRRLS